VTLFERNGTPAMGLADVAVILAEVFPIGFRKVRRNAWGLE
jgi:hypothetical protein